MISSESSKKNLRKRNKNDQRQNSLWTGGLINKSNFQHKWFMMWKFYAILSYCCCSCCCWCFRFWRLNLPIQSHHTPLTRNWMERWTSREKQTKNRIRKQEIHENILTYFKETTIAWKYDRYVSAVINSVHNRQCHSFAEHCRRAHAKNQCYCFSFSTGGFYLIRKCGHEFLLLCKHCRLMLNLNVSRSDICE